MVLDEPLPSHAAVQQNSYVPQPTVPQPVLQSANVSFGGFEGPNVAYAPAPELPPTPSQPYVPEQTHQEKGSPGSPPGGGEREQASTICGMCGEFYPEGQPFCASCGSPCRPAETTDVTLGVSEQMASMRMEADKSIEEYVISKSWWVGIMTRVESEKMLESAVPGSFLLRQRMGGPGLTLTVKNIQRCKHYQICETDGHYKILSSMPSPYFTTIRELLQYYHTTTILGGLALSDPDETGAAIEPAETSVEDNLQPLSIDLTSSKQCPTCSAEISEGAVFCKGCGGKINLVQTAPASVSNGSNQPTPAVRRGGGGALESTRYRSLADDINGSSKLYGLIALGNDILEAAKGNVLFDGELEKLRKLYRIRRGILAYGCLKSAWDRNKSTPVCTHAGCGNKFTSTHRRHHCRCCGKVICKGCSQNKFERAGLRMNKVCPTCYEFLSMVATGHVRQAIEQFSELASY